MRRKRVVGCNKKFCKNLQFKLKTLQMESLTLLVINKINKLNKVSATALKSYLLLFFSSNRKIFLYKIYIHFFMFVPSRFFKHIFFNIG